MSYTDPDWAYFGSGGNREFTISQSYMVYDIMALQYLYGANFDYNAGDTVYLFDSSNPTSFTIWDGR